MSDNVIHQVGDFRRDAIEAAAAFYPGHLLELTSAGEVQKHSTEGGYAERMLAIEDALQGSTIDTAYADGDLTAINHEQPGSEAMVYIQAGQDIAIGDLLISGGDGTLIENGQESSGTTVKQIIAVAVEANDLTGSGAVDTRSRVRLL